MNTTKSILSPRMTPHIAAGFLPAYTVANAIARNIGKCRNQDQLTGCASWMYRANQQYGKCFSQLYDLLDDLLRTKHTALKVAAFKVDSAARTKQMSEQLYPCSTSLS